MPPATRELWKRTLLSSVTGALAWSGPAALIPVSLLFPVLCRWPHPAILTRERLLIAFVYHAAALWPLFPSGVGLYGWSAIPFLAAAWIMVGGFLAMPWSFLPIPLALLVAAIPPLGIIGVAHPITSSGVLFPGTTWIGLAFTAALPTLLVRFLRPTAALAIGLSLATNLTYEESPAPRSWEGINTEFGRLGKDAGSEFRAAEFIQSTALNTRSRVLVFPEIVVTRWTEATTAFWLPTLDLLAQRQAILIVGAAVPIKQTRDYRNALIVAGGETGHFFQRIPLPWVMWNPLAANDHVPLNLWRSGILNVAGERAAILICYEQLIPWPILSAAAERPSVILAVSNATWTNGTPVPSIQGASVTAWSHLFGLPVVSAVNR